MAAIQKSERKTHLEMEQIPISTNKFDAKAKFTFKEVALKFGMRHHLFYEQPMTPYIGYGVKLINADIKEERLRITRTRIHML